MLEMTAVRSTTGNYYGALRDDASDGTAETDIPDPDPEALRSEDSPLHHLPSEVLAVVLQYLTTAAPFLWCNSGDRLRLTRMTQRLSLIGMGSMSNPSTAGGPWCARICLESAGIFLAK